MTKLYYYLLPTGHLFTNQGKWGQTGVIQHLRITNEGCYKITAYGAQGGDYESK